MEAVTKFTEQHVEFPTLPLWLSSAEKNNNNTTADTAADAVDARLDSTIVISDPYWLFVGRNTSTTAPMLGRSEHTDSIVHDGTFHFQVVGQKTWKLRPTSELRELCDERWDLALKDHYVVTVEEGDIIVINTRLWWHQTEIPGCCDSIAAAGTGTAGVDEPTTDSNSGEQKYAEEEIAASPSSSSGLSISYARDIYFDGNQPNKGQDTEYMSSIDGAWATGFIAKGTVLFTENNKDPPIRQSNEKQKTNCEMFQVEDDDEQGGTQLAVVTSKDIMEGEFFIMYNGNDDLDDDDYSSSEEEAERD